MKYNFKEYKAIFDTPMKRQQELAISRKIMDLLNKNKYVNLEEFIAKNDNYQDFLKKNNMQTVIKHFGNTLKEEDYVKILENLRMLTKQKQSFEEENIKTTNINDNQYNFFEGQDKSYFIDNSKTDKTIEEQMRDLQPTQQQFQTTDPRENTERMFKELENRKDGLNYSYLNQINFDLLTDEEKELFAIANDFQRNTKGAVKVDLKKGIIVDEHNNLYKIQKNNGEFSIIGDSNSIQTAIEIKEKPNQKKMVLTHSANTIYSN